MFPEKMFNTLNKNILQNIFKLLVLSIRLIIIFLNINFMRNKQNRIHSEDIQTLNF